MVTFKSFAAVAALTLVQQAHAWYAELPACLDPFQPFVYSGCFKDDDGETLSHRFSIDQTNMTVEKCVATCKGNGYRYAGLEYYGVCFCGATVNGALLDESQCSQPCSGNKSQTCGNDHNLSVYQDPTYLPLAEQTLDDYTAVGCWTDDPVNGRALVHQQNLDKDSMTPTKCTQACLTNGYPFAGTEYAGECFCGVVIGNGTQKADESECNMPCTGDSTKMCGGSKRLNMYVAKDLESLQPCGYVPPVVSSSSSSVISVSTVSSSSAASSSSSAVTTSSATSSCSSAVTSSAATSSSSSAVTTSAATSSSSSAVTSSSAASSSSSVSSSSIPQTTTTKAPTSTSCSTTSTPKPNTSTSCLTTSTTKPTISTSCLTTSTTKPPSSIPQTTTTKAPTTTSIPTTTPPKISSTSTTSSAVCTTTTITPGDCEYGCGKFCAKPLPYWSDDKDTYDCSTGHSSCKIQVAACFKNAGWPSAAACFEFSAFCDGVKDYCNTNPKGNKWDCFKKNPPKGGNPPTTKVTTVPCKPTTSSVPIPPTVPVPNPDTVCKQPSSWWYNYGPGNPVGGIELPVVTCNNVEAEFKAGNQLKLYVEADTKLCGSWGRNKAPDACNAACKTQYDNCINVYVEGCKSRRRSTEDNYFEARSSEGGLDKRTLWPFFDNSAFALIKCKAQYADCIVENKIANLGSKCSTYNQW